MEKATFAAGCFWGVEAEFMNVKGVASTSVGYTGGNFKNPTYGDVSTDRTGHAEAVQIEFDPVKVSYEKLLDVFWRLHYPGQLKGHDPYIGTHYRSAIFYHNEQQKKKAIASKEKLQKMYNSKIATEIVPAKEFYKAEEFHQRFLEKRGLKNMC